MQKITDWLYKTLDAISNTDLFRLYFTGCQLTNEDEYDFYLTNLKQGIGLVLSENKAVTTIHLYGSSKGVFRGDIPQKVDFSHSRAAIIVRFGKPFRSGERHKHLYLGIVHSWGKYLLADYSIRFEYSDDEDKIVLTTLASLSIEPYLNASLQ